MNTRSSASRIRLLLLCLAAPLATLLAGPAACTDPDQFLPSYQPGGPQGILGGTVTYLGPLPCTSQQHVVGAAVLLVFSTDLLPPPAGLGTTAASLGTVGGDTLFGGVVDQLTFNKDGSPWCPAPGTQVTVSSPWTIGPLAGGVYEVQGFYDYSGTFDPVFSITKLPVKGDIAGGAVENATAVLMGADPVYRQIALGTKEPDTCQSTSLASAGGGGGGGSSGTGGSSGGQACSKDSDCASGEVCASGGYQIPAEGSNIDGISVTLALPLPLNLPVFYPAAVAYSSYDCEGTNVNMVTPAPSDPTKITMPSDYQIPVFNTASPTMTAGSLITLDLKAGVLPAEVAAASKVPFSLPVASPPPTFTFSWDNAHTFSAASNLLPSLYPLSILSKLEETDDDLTAQSSPVVIIQGLTLYKSLLDTVLWATNPPANNAEVTTDVFVGVPPAALCIDIANPNAPATLVLTHQTDCEGNDILADDGEPTKLALEAQFNRTVNLVYGCLPQGHYAMNLVYGTGQAWSDPNEAGVCQTGETESANGQSCAGSLASRARLSSQDRLLTIGPPVHPSYCTGANAVPPQCCPNGKCP
jgi:hypothetical protein